jgi:hypothetical protein
MVSSTEYQPQRSGLSRDNSPFKQSAPFYI